MIWVAAPAPDHDPGFARTTANVVFEKNSTRISSLLLRLFDWFRNLLHDRIMHHRAEALDAEIRFPQKDAIGQ